MFQHVLPAVSAVTTALQRNLLWECRLETSGSRSCPLSRFGMSGVISLGCQCVPCGLPRSSLCLNGEYVYCVYNASQENPPEYTIIQNASQTDLTLGLCYRYRSVLSVFFGHENTVSKNAVNTELLPANDAHVVNGRVTSAAIRLKHKPVTRYDICVLTAMSSLLRCYAVSMRI